MGKIFAAGILKGVYTEVTVTLKDGKINISGRGMDNTELQIRFDQLNSLPCPIGGTYFPEKDSLLNIYNLLANYFFDSQVEPDVLEGEIEQLPYEEGRVY